MERLYSFSRKLFILLSLIGITSLVAFSFEVKNDTNKDSLQVIIKSLEQKHNVSIIYEAEVLNKIKKPSKAEILKQNNIEDALKVLLKDSDVTFKKMRDDFYVIILKKKLKSDVISVELGKQHTFRGQVFDSHNMPLPGATVYIKNTTIGTATDPDGNFTLNFTDKSVVLTISFIGYKSVNINATDRVPINVKLEEDLFGIDEVVVSGVAANTPVKKLTVTVAKINADKLNQAPAASASSALRGKVSGVQVVKSGGTPGSGASIRLRGSTSIVGNSAPLILVDGNILESSLADINVDDIKSMEVVKGAAAASLYGSKAGNGVILVTTKRGKSLKEGTSEVTFRSEFGRSSLENQIELAERHPYKLASDYDQFSTFTKYSGVKYDDNGNVTRGSRSLNDTHYADQPYAYVNDNQGDFFNPGSFKTNYISLAGRSKKSNVFMSYENNQQDGILFSTNGYKRNNYRVNVDYHITDKLKLSTSNLIINTESDNPGSTSAFFDLLFISPDVNLETVNEDGSPYNITPDIWSIEENPLYPLYYRERSSTRNSILSNIIASYSPFDWLSLNAKYTFEKLNKHWSTITPRGYLYGGGTSIGGRVYKEQYTSTFKTFQYTLNLNKSIHDFNLKSKISYLFEDNDYHDFSATGSNLIFSNIYQLNTTDPAISKLNSYEGIIRAENVFGILDVDYKSKYLLSGLYRMDGSSLFGVNERWNPYFRFSGAYRITQDFYIPGINELKIRVAYGTAGQRPGFNNQYETMSLVDGEPKKEQLGNKNLKPSQSAETEFAIDAEIMNKITFNASYSITNTSDAFALAPLPSHLGYPAQWENVATINSNSFEATLGYVALNKKDLSLKFNVTFDKVTQKITELYIPEYKTGPKNAFFMREGETIGTMYGNKWLTSLSQMENQLPVGMSIDEYMLNSDGYVIEKGTEGTINESPILYDKGGDGAADIVKIGDGNPDFHMSLNMTFRWKAISLYTLWDWKQGGDIYNYTHQYTFRDNRAIEFDQFEVPKSEKKTIDYYSTFYNHTAINSYFIEDGSYVKLRELSLYYDLKTKSTKGIGKLVSSVRFGLVGHNLFSFTNYSGYDPEVSSGGDLSNYSFDNFGYPNYRTITGSIQFKFN